MRRLRDVGGCTKVSPHLGVQRARAAKHICAGAARQQSGTILLRNRCVPVEHVRLASVSEGAGVAADPKYTYAGIHSWYVGATSDVNLWGLV
jgi:hypothetical protein